MGYKTPTIRVKYGYSIKDALEKAQNRANKSGKAVAVLVQYYQKPTFDGARGKMYWEILDTVLPTRTSNPTVSVSSLPIGTWQPAHAIRQNADGSVDILREKNSGKRRANISEGFMAGGVFHPIRSAADYDASRVGESKGKKRKAPARKKASTKRAMATSRRDYGGDGGRYRNAGKGTKWALIKDGTAKPLSIYHSKTDANTAWKHLSGKYPKGKSPYWVEKYNW